MLRRGRLLLSQAPSPEWTVSASPNIARRAYSRPQLPLSGLVSRHSALATEVDAQSTEQSPTNGLAERDQHGQHDQPSSKSEPAAGPSHTPSILPREGRRIAAFRKYVASADTGPVQEQGNNCPGPSFRKYLTFADTEATSNQQKDRDSTNQPNESDPQVQQNVGFVAENDWRYGVHGRSPSTKLPTRRHVSSGQTGTARKDSPTPQASPNGAKNMEETEQNVLSQQKEQPRPRDASRWNAYWIQQVGRRLGLRLSMRDAIYFKLKVAARLGFAAIDSRLATPAAAFAAIDEQKRMAKAAAVAMAQARQADLSAKGRTPMAFQRVERLQWGTEPQYVQPRVSDLISTTPIRDSSEDSQATPAQPRTTTSTRVDAGPWNNPLGGTRSPWQPFSGERAPTGIRFTVMPPWRPTDRPMKQWGPNATEEQPATAPTGGLLYESAILETDSDSQRKPQHAADTEDKPLSPLNPPSSYALWTKKPAEPKEAPTEAHTETPSNASGKPSSTEHDHGNPSESSPKLGVAKGDTDWKITPARSLDKIRGGIFKQLFPDESGEELGSQPKEKSSPSTEELAGDSIFISLRNEIRNWIPEDERKKITAPEPGEYGSQSTVIMLSGLSNSLVDTDFYRILPETRHIEGWAGGLVKVVQARDRLTHEPIGRYFLMFHSKPAASAYKAEVLRLHDLSKRLLHRTTGTGLLNDAPADPQPFLTNEEQAAARAFTICPPTAPLRINVHMWNTNLVREIAKDTNIADVVQALRPDVATPAKVLVTVNTAPGSKAGVGGGLTADELWLTLRDDGRERGAPWVLVNLTEGIMPVKLRSISRHNKIDIRAEAVHAPLVGPIYDEVDMLAELPPAAAMAAGEPAPFVARRVALDTVWDRQAWNEGRAGRLAPAPEDAAAPPRRGVAVARDARFRRFVVTFAQSAAARRFVRSWHRRAIWDAHMQRSVTIDAVALM